MQSLSIYEGRSGFSVIEPAVSGEVYIEEIIREEKEGELYCSYNPLIDMVAFSSLSKRINCDDPCECLKSIDAQYSKSLQSYQALIEKAKKMDDAHYEVIRWGKIITGVSWGIGIGGTTASIISRCVQIAWRTTFVFSSIAVGGVVGAGCGEFLALIDRPNGNKAMIEIYNHEISNFGLLSSDLQLRLVNIDKKLSKMFVGDAGRDELKQEKKQLKNLTNYCISVLKRSSENGFQNSFSEFARFLSYKG
jgi:hypothetical protein